MMTDAEREMLALMIGQHVRDSRKLSGLSQMDLAQGIGSQSMISLIESGRQLPLPDVLQLLATKLNDPVLQNYADMLSKGEVDIESISVLNHSVALNALRTQRGRWQDIYGKVAIQLCEHHYTNRIFEICREICQLVDLHSDSETYRALAYFYHGSSYLNEGTIERAEPLLRRAESLQDKLDVLMQGKLMYNLAYMYTALDVQGMAMWHAKRSSDIFSGLHDFPKQAKALGLLGTIQHRIGLFEDARSTLELALTIADKWQIDEVDYARMMSSLGETHVELKNYELAKTWAERAVDVASQCFDVPSLSAAYRTQYLAQTMMGFTHDADDALEKAIQLIESSEKIPYAAHTFLLSINHLPTAEEKIAAAQKAFEYASDANSSIEKAFAAECLARLHEHENRPQMATHYLRIALRSYREHTQQNTMFRNMMCLLPID